MNLWNTMVLRRSGLINTHKLFLDTFDFFKKTRHQTSKKFYSWEKHSCRRQLFCFIFFVFFVFLFFFAKKKMVYFRVYLFSVFLFFFFFLFFVLITAFSVYTENYCPRFKYRPSLRAWYGKRGQYSRYKLKKPIYYCNYCQDMLKMY